VVDSEGRPLVVYHGGQRLTAWNRKGDGRQIYGGHAQAVKDAYGSMLSPLERQALDKPVHFFTDDLSVAEGYADQGEHYEVRSEFLRMERPLDLRADVVGDEVVERHLRRILGPDFEMPSPGYGQEREISQALRWNWSRVREAVEQMGYDGIILYDTDVRDRGLHTSYAVFEPSQIKSADANDGSFDLDDPDRLSQEASSREPRGTFDPRTLEIALGPKADASTWIHETGHFFLEALTELASAPDAPKDIVEDMNRVLEWFGIESDPALPRRRTALETWLAMSIDERRPHHERWARAVEQYVMEGNAPNEELEPLFKTFARWLCSLYTSVKEFLAMRSGRSADVAATVPGAQDAPGGAPASPQKLEQQTPRAPPPCPTEAPAFRSWFGDSKVVDGEGRPLVLHHGSPAEFNAFDPRKAKDGSFGRGFYFTNFTHVAGSYGPARDFYLSMQNPASMQDGLSVAFDTERLKRRGFDGILIQMKASGETIAVAFSPEQIKSASSNDGTFDRDDSSTLSQEPTATHAAMAAPADPLTDEIRGVMDRLLARMDDLDADQDGESSRPRMRSA
jgi:hypothetical protein